MRHGVHVLVAIVACVCGTLSGHGGDAHVVTAAGVAAKLPSMDAEAFPDRSLAESFLRGQEAVHWLESTHEPSVSEVYQAKVQDALECFRAASQLVRRLSIFSTNETAEDINTTDLKFLLSEFYLAQCELKVTGEDRATHVRRAQVLQDLFLANCERVGLLSAQDLEELRAGVDAPVDRTTKIERYKRERAAKQRLEVREAALLTASALPRAHTCLERRN